MPGLPRMRLLFNPEEVDDERHIVVGPPGVPHAFTNTGDGMLRLTAIHAGSEFDTKWLVGDDPVWTSDVAE